MGMQKDPDVTLKTTRKFNSGAVEQDYWCIAEGTADRERTTRLGLATAANNESSACNPSHSNR